MRINKLPFINVKLILTALALGLIHGIISLFGFVHGFEYHIWVLLSLFFVSWIVVKAKNQIFLMGFLIGLAISIGTGLVQGIFLETYLLNNPDYSEQLDPKINYRLFTLTFMLVFGAIYGAVIGSISLAINKVIERWDNKSTLL